MNDASALYRLKQMVAADDRPTLSQGEVRDLLEMAKLADSEDRAPTDPEWVPSYNLNLAAAEGWRQKAGKVAAKFRVQGGGQTLARDQVHRHCLRMAEQYEKKLAAGAGGIQSVRAPGNLVVDRGSASSRTADYYRLVVN